MNDRIVRILDILSRNKKIKINLFAELLDVSRITLRRDLEKLERRGILRLTHGYADLDGADDTGKRIAFDYSIKRRIAKAAADIVQENETIMVESGSCCTLFAEELAFARKNNTIITNSIFIANYIGRLPNIKIIILSGIFQPDSQVTVGSMTSACMESIYTGKYFLGADGYIPDLGFTGSDYLRAETAANLAEHVDKIYILTESAKFSRRGPYSLISFDKIAGVFTDDGIPKEAEAAILNSGAELHKVPSVEEKIKWRQFPGLTPFLYTEKK
uniref:Transcriptional regulator, DeoR family n=1 Tax=uncultured bacterium contig00008 TaxID=1181500 RepID=A0A806KGB1_9BACT|nr:transcriptional regulator, DeoR family [uncultured bacterium contig00008]